MPLPPRTIRSTRRRGAVFLQRLSKKARNINGFRAFGKWHFSVKTVFDRPIFNALEVMQMGGKLDTNSGGKAPVDGTLVTIALADLQPFSGHSYKVRDDEAMRDMVESIKRYGVLSPAIARPMPDVTTLKANIDYLLGCSEPGGKRNRSVRDCDVDTLGKLVPKSGFGEAPQQVDFRRLARGGRGCGSQSS